MSYELNKEQKTAVEHRRGPLLIIAGAGTGKTQVITQRIMNIMKEGWAKPSEILALTFMEKAAAEMQERVDQEMPLSYEEPTISTFHSFCDMVLRQESFFLGLDSSYRLMSESESYVFFKKNIFKFPLDEYRPLNNPSKFISTILKYFSRLQDEDISPKEYLKYAKGKEGHLELAKTYEEFEKLKVKEGKMTFADLLTTILKLFREKPQILKKYQEKFKYVLIDEFQDTNYAQNEMINLLVGGSKERNITVVGDDDQAIYKFRGAAISNILKFKEVYPDAKRVVLTKNYRSNQDILDSAYGLIRNNDPYRLEVTENIDKRLVAENGSSKNAVNLIPVSNALEEAEAIALEILKLTGSDFKFKRDDYLVFDSKGQSSFLDSDSERKYDFSEISILVRANAHADEIIPLLRYYKIPYKFSGKKGLYFRPEVKFFISFLKIIADYKDNVSFFNVLQMDVWDLEVRDFIEIFSESKRMYISAFEFLEFLLGERVGSKTSLKREKLLSKTFSKSSIVSLKKLMGIYKDVFKMVKEGKGTGELIFHFFDKSGYLKKLESGSPEDEFRIQNIAKFFDIVKKFEQNNKGGTVYEYIDYLEYSIDVGETPSIDDDVFVDYDAVNISTVHGAKGLEYPVVFLPSLVKNRFPSVNRSEKISVPKELMKEEYPDEEESGSNIQEERRLFYVAATRAKEKLFLSAAQHYGEGKRVNKPSIFLNEILNREKLEEFDNVVAERSFNFMKNSDVDDIDYTAFKKDLGSFVSYSQINDYEACPKKYKYKYVLNIPVPMGHPAVFGTIVHSTLRDFFNLLKSSNEGLDGIVSKPTLDDLLSFYEKNWRSEGFVDKKHEVAKKKKGVEMLKNFFENMYTGNETILDIEKKFKINLQDIIITGAIDRVDSLENGMVELIDYKTGKSKDQKEVEKDIQLMIYGLYARDVMGIRDIKASLLFLDDGVKIETLVDDEKLNFVKERVLSVSGLIKKSRFEPKPDFMGCRYCDYKNICDNAFV